MRKAFLKLPFGHLHYRCAGWEALSHTRQSGLALGPAARILDLPPAFGDWANKIIAAPEQAD